MSRGAAWAIVLLLGVIAALLAWTPAHADRSSRAHMIKPSRWEATADYSEASGRRTCIVRRGSNPIVVIFVRAPDGTEAKALTIHGTDYGLYPGREIYIAIDGQRFAGVEQIWVTPELLASLRTGEWMLAEWSPWPSGGAETARVYLEGFAPAYEECVAEMARLRE